MGVIRKDKDMWLENLKELKKTSGMSSKQIAEKTKLPERTVIRIFSGETDNPYVDTLLRIVNVLGGSLDDILADTKSVLSNTDLQTLREEHERLTNEVTALQAEITRLKGEMAEAATEITLLRLKLEHKEELLALHNYYNNRK